MEPATATTGTVRERNDISCTSVTFYVGAARGPSGLCDARAPGFYYLVADCIIQSVLALALIVIGVIVLRNLRQLGGFGKNAVTLTAVFSVISCSAFLLDRLLMLIKGLTPEWYDVCCYFVLQDPRKHHRLRWAEVAALVIGVYFALFALVQVALSWLEIAMKTIRMSSRTSPLVVKLRYFYYGLEFFAGIAYIVLLFVNIGFASVLAIIAYLLLGGSFLYAEKQIYPVLASSATLEGNDSGSYNAYRTLLSQIRITTYGIIGMGLVTITGAGVYFYTNLAGNHDWKDFAPPGEISINYVGNAMITLGWLLMLAFVLWFLYQRTSATKKYSSAGAKHRETKFSHSFEPTQQIIHDI